MGPWGLIGGWSPLSTAATMNSAKGVALLLESGASPSLGLGVGPLGAVVSNSPLYYAATKGYTEVVKELVWAGVVLDLQDEHQCTALMHAASWGKKEKKCKEKHSYHNELFHLLVLYLKMAPRGFRRKY